MLLRRPTTTTTALLLLLRHLSSTTTTTSNPTKPFSKIPWKHRSKAIQDSQKALTDYLHATRCLPFLYADNIARNSPQSLSKIVTEIPFSPSDFASSFQRFLRYHPINELEFFLESIGLNCDETKNPPPNTFFLSDWKHFDVACALAGMGFPWSKLGFLCKDEFLIFEIEPAELRRRVGEIKGVYGFDSVTVISICLAFPRVLYDDDDDDDEVVDGLLSGLKVLFLDYGLWGCVEGNVDAVFEVCEKIKCFYDVGCGVGEIGELMGRSKSVFVEYSKEELVSKIEYFCKLNVGKDQVVKFLLSRPEIFGFDLGDRVVSVVGLLERLGLSKNELKLLRLNYPHVFGRNKVGNLPHVMRSMDLGEWFFERLKSGNHSLLATYTICSTEDLDEHYEDNLRKIQAKRTHAHAIKKLKFLHSIGFGENKYAVKALSLLNSSNSQLHRRFDCLLKCGIEYSKLCAIVRLLPKVLNQQESSLEKKIAYLCNEMGWSLEYLHVFPGYLCYDLEKRIKPRYKLHKWLAEQGLCKKEYSLSTIIASSEKAFVARLSRIDLEAAKKWQENHANWTME